MCLPRARAIALSAEPTEILVTAGSDIVNGDVSRVPALLAHPGLDGIRDVEIDENVIDTPSVAISVIGGYGPTASGNVVADVHIGDNRMVGAGTEVQIIANDLGPSGNTVSATVPASPSPEAPITPSPAPAASPSSSGTAALAGRDWFIRPQSPPSPSGRGPTLAVRRRGDANR